MLTMEVNEILNPCEGPVSPHHLDEESLEDLCQWLKDQDLDLTQTTTSSTLGLGNPLPADNTEKLDFIPKAVLTRLQNDQTTSFKQFHKVEQFLSDKEDSRISGPLHCREVIKESIFAKAPQGFWKRWTATSSRMIHRCPQYLSNSPQLVLLDYKKKPNSQHLVLRGAFPTHVEPLRLTQENPNNDDHHFDKEPEEREEGEDRAWA